MSHDQLIEKCKCCGKLFPLQQVRLCQGCALNPENRFELVRAYLKAHNGAALVEISEGTGLSVSEIARFQNDGRLVDVDPAFSGPADICTCTGVSGRCAFCKRQAALALREAAGLDMNGWKAPERKMTIAQEMAGPEERPHYGDPDTPRKRRAPKDDPDRVQYVVRRRRAG